MGHCSPQLVAIYSDSVLPHEQRTAAEVVMCLAFKVVKVLLVVIKE